MINLDAYVIDFVNGNWLTLTMALGLLKIIAKATPWVFDDAIHTLLAGTFGLIKKPPVGVPPLKDRGELVE